MIVQFFIHLHAELNSQWPITQPARMQTKTAIKQTQGQPPPPPKNQLRLFIYKHKFLKVSIHLQTALPATHLAAGQWLEEHLTIRKLLIFQIRT
jgi:hypothetical protein